MQVTLLVRAPKKPEKRVTVDSDVVIGRAKGCNLQVLSNDVSRKHCRLVIGESTVAIRDLGSGNGTLLNGQRTEPNKDAPLISGDIVRIGPLVIRVDFHASPLLPVSSPATTTDPESDPEGSEQILEPVSVEPVPTEDAAPVETTEAAVITEPGVEPLEDTDLLPDDEPAADEFAEADPEEIATLDAADDEPLQEEQAPKKKSLFGMFGKKKDKAEPAAEAPAAPLDSEPALEPLSDVKEAGLDEEPVVVAEENSFTSDEAESAIEPLSDDDFVDDDDYLDHDFEDDVEDEAVDPGFADFLNNVDPPAR